MNTQHVSTWLFSMIPHEHIHAIKWHKVSCEWIVALTVIYGPSLEFHSATFPTSFEEVTYQACSRTRTLKGSVESLAIFIVSRWPPCENWKRLYGYTPNNKLHTYSVKPHQEIIRRLISITMPGISNLPFLVSCNQLQVRHVSKLANYCIWPGE